MLPILQVSLILICFNFILESLVLLCFYLLGDPLEDDENDVDDDDPVDENDHHVIT